MSIALLCRVDSWYNHKLVAIRGAAHGEAASAGDVMSDRGNPRAVPTIPLAIYQALVDRCARERLNLDIANGSALHARILIDKLFEIARTSVCLVSGSIRESSNRGVEIYAHQKVIDSAKRFLTLPGSRLDVVVQSGIIDRETENRFLRSITSDPSRCGTVALYIPHVGVLAEDNTSHFMVADRSAYRFETGKDANPDNEKITAVANFGDVSTARTLGNIFDDILSLLNANRNMHNVLELAPGQSF
jgi:hypothetical protein